MKKNGVSNFMGYLMLKPTLEKNSKNTVRPKAGKDKKDYTTFTKVLVQKWT